MQYLYTFVNTRTVLDSIYRCETHLKGFLHTVGYSSNVPLYIYRYVLPLNMVGSDTAVLSSPCYCIQVQTLYKYRTVPVPGAFRLKQNSPCMYSTVYKSFRYVQVHQCINAHSGVTVFFQQNYLL
jgi:hypothetical protein